MMVLAHAQPKLFDTEHAQGRKLQTEKIAFEVRGHASIEERRIESGLVLFCVISVSAPSSGVEERNVNKRTCQYSEAIKYHNKYVSANHAFIDRIK